MLHRGLGGEGIFLLAYALAARSAPGVSSSPPSARTHHPHAQRRRRPAGPQHLHFPSPPAHACEARRARGRPRRRDTGWWRRDAARATATGLNGRWEGGNARRGPFAQTQTGRRQIDLTAVERTSAAELRRTGWRSICTVLQSRCSTVSPSRLCAGPWVGRGGVAGMAICTY